MITLKSEEQEFPELDLLTEQEKMAAIALLEESLNIWNFENFILAQEINGEAPDTHPKKNHVATYLYIRDQMVLAESDIGEARKINGKLDQIEILSQYLSKSEYGRVLGYGTVNGIGSLCI